MAPASTLHDVLQGWVEAGLLDTTQADGIERFERRAPPRHHRPRLPGSR